MTLLLQVVKNVNVMVMEIRIKENAIWKLEYASVRTIPGATIAIVVSQNISEIRSTVSSVTSNVIEVSYENLTDKGSVQDKPTFHHGVERLQENVCGL